MGHFYGVQVILRYIAKSLLVKIFILFWEVLWASLSC